LGNINHEKKDVNDAALEVAHGGQRAQESANGKVKCPNT